MLNWFDLVALILLLIAFINGYRKGLVMMLVGLATVILAAIFAGRLAVIIQPYIEQLFNPSPQVTNVLSYAAAFLSIAAVISIIAFFIQKIFETIHLNFVNRILGSVVSLGTTMVVLSVLLNLVLMLDSDKTIIKPDIREKSFFYDRIQAVVPAIVPYLNKDVWQDYVPEKYRKQIESYDGEPLVPGAGNPIDSAFQQKYFETDSI
ncbi:MAG: CvpA family protein [Bacteroidia bacterium]|nr:CvpA family protein [Bacteroidia bacterium]